ncbi:MAG: SpvB/TcaC N-terminal domain-containing protein [Luteibacter sp.]
MTQWDNMPMLALSLPTAGGAPSGTAGAWGQPDPSGVANFSLALPISRGRGFAPDLTLRYTSASGSSEYGHGWSLTLPWIGRRTSKGIPAYAADDIVQSSSAGVLLPSLDASDRPIVRRVASFRGHTFDRPYQVVEYFPRHRGDGSRWERWQGDGEEFWLGHDVEGVAHLFGKRERTEDDVAGGRRTVQWHLEESVTPRGERILYEYLHEDAEGLSTEDRARDHARRRYLCRVRYGNTEADACPHLLRGEPGGVTGWFFDLVFDYGQRALGEDEVPGYEATSAWPRRPDPYARYGTGFEIRSLRLCRQVLMFHTFAASMAADPAGAKDVALGERPVLVRRLLLEHDSDAFASRLISAQVMGYASDGRVERLPPMEFRYAAFDPPDEARFEPFGTLADAAGVAGMEVTTGKLPFSLVDLYGEGLPGLLVQRGQQWWYSAPVRGDAGGDAIAYARPELLSRAPVAGRPGAGVMQWMGDMDGDGRLDWMVARPGMAGYFALRPGGGWSGFTPMGGMPGEFFDGQGQHVDVTGDGLTDLVLVGTRSVHLYANGGKQGFAAPREVPHTGVPLPGRGGRTAHVAFADLLGSGQAHLFEARHDRLRVWPNLGMGVFGAAIDFARLPFAPAEFDPSRLRFADLDGSGATDVLYLRSDRLQVFRNQGGNGLAEPVDVPWPEGVRYDRLCELRVADLQGMGCASLVLTVPYTQGCHWRCDFVRSARPQLLVASDNNMGASVEVAYRGSAQEWLDAKREDPGAISHLPFSVQTVSTQTQVDQVSGNRLVEGFSHREGHYDGDEREFLGFALVMHRSGSAATAGDEGVTPGTLTKTWFHTGAAIDADRSGFNDGDAGAMRLGATLCRRYDPVGDGDEPVDDWDAATLACAARTLTGRTCRVERYGLGTDAATVPMDVLETRYLVRQYLPRSAARPYPAMQAFVAETIAWQYEQHFADPRCTQTVAMAWDRHGGETRGVVVYHPRRDDASSPFPADMPGREYHQRWWDDAHDEAQGSWYLTDTLSERIHVEDVDWWRPHMPYRTLSRAAILSVDRMTGRTPAYESMRAPDSPLAEDGFVMSGQHVQRYQGHADGRADAVGLAAPLESAEFDPPALAAYREVLDATALREHLTDAGYEPMTELVMNTAAPWSGVSEGTAELWSAKRGIATFDTAEAFHRVIAYRETATLGETHIAYEPFGCFPARVTLPDGCATQVEYDYRVLLPWRSTDANGTVSEVLLDGLGRAVATSLYGTEYGQPAGFDPVADFVRQVDTADQAVAAPWLAVQEAATATLVEPFSWMATVDQTLATELRGQGLGHWLARGNRLRASARRGWRGVPPARVTRLALLALPRQPVHVVTIVSDQYTHHAEPPPHPAHVGLANPPRFEVPERQHRIDVRYFDGFGRSLQSRQKVPPGEALLSNEGELVLDGDGKPTVGDVETRWRVSAPVAFNDRGQVCRIYRPYFADTYRTVRDDGYRATGYVDRLFYDAAGRLVVTLTAAGYMRRSTYYPWHTVAEDENDTADELQELKDSRLPLDGHRLGRRAERRDSPIP